MKNTKAVKAKLGEKCLQIRIYFFTDNIAANKGEIVPKHASDCGGVVMPSNAAHGIEWSDDKGAMFNSILDIPAAIMSTLAQHGVTVHLGRAQSRKAR
jgi:hypothetical protein